jgi:hypothetical protein
VSHCCRGLGVQFAFQLAVDEQPAHSGADAAVFVPQRLAAAAAVEEQATVPVFPVPPDHRPLAPQVLLRLALLALLLLGYLRIQVAQVALHLHTPEGPGTTWRRATVDPVRWAGAAEKQNRETLRAKLEGQSEFRRRESAGRSRRGHCPVGVPCVDCGASWRLLGRWEGCRIPYAPLAAGWPAAAVVLGVGGVSGPEGGPGYLCKKGRQKGEARHGVCGC